MNSTERQLTFDPKGHFLNNNQCFSHNGGWIVYDTRNDDTKIGSTAEIEMLNVQTGEVSLLYRTQNQTEFGPGVGAVSLSPAADKVIFIHGIRNANETKPYSFTRRTGVAVNIHQPGEPIFMDARDIKAPFTPGALRGGTHAHSWSGDGNWISFTYNDYIIEQLSQCDSTVKDLRTVGVMFPRVVEVKEVGDLENNSGQMYAVIISEVTENPVPDTDEIDKAFDEGWIGTNGYLKSDGSWQGKALAFQGNVRDKKGNSKTEIFIVDLPEDLTQCVPGQPLEGTLTTRPGVPIGVKQRRITHLKHGIEGPRHWLRSTPDGQKIVFLSKDDTGFINAFSVSPHGGIVKQLTNHQFDIQSGVNISPDGQHLAYVADNSVYTTAIATGETNKLTERTSDDTKPMGCVIWSPDSKTLAYNRYVNQDKGKFLQIFLLKIK
ncbi:DUF3748 domain-containing protein [Pedobacter immunditicola]|uniref:DUF3748 domain-containing protein n=1 Tax=Pedobacter immunditicola TaxID=3133440 RepID=UPI0030B7380C